MTRAKRPKPRPVAAVPPFGWAPLAIVVAAALTYANSLWGPFIFDDFGAIVRNPQIRDLGNWARLLVPPAETSVSGRPLVNVSFALSYALGGLNVVGYHIVDIALHTASALFVFGLARRTLETTSRHAAGLALAIAAIWVVHPLNSDAVDYLTQRTELLMAFCYLLTMYACLRAAGPDRRTLWTATALVSCAAGMACKETMVTAPLMVLLYDRAFLFASFREAFAARWRLYAGLAATWLILLVLVVSQGQTTTAGFATAQVSSWTYFLNQTVMITRYLFLAIWPRSLVFYYGWPRPLALVDVWPYALVLTVLFAGTILALIRRPRLGFLGAWIFITLSPSSSFVTVATEVGAERRMYLPLIAVVALAVLSVDHVWTRVRDRAGTQPRDRRAILAGVAIVISVALAACTVVRNREYASALTMAQTVLARWPTPNAHQLVGVELAAGGKHDEAIEHLRVAASGYPPARYFLGSELFAVGKFDEAIEQLQTFVREEPALATRASRLLIARAFAATGRWPQALEQLDRILAATPSDAGIHGMMADAMAGQRQFSDAIPHYRAYLQASPRDANAWTGLGVALATTGQSKDAVVAFRNAVAAAPDDGHFHQNLARALLDQGNAAEAAGEAQRAATIDPVDPAAHEVLGRVLAAQGRLDDARRQFERALQLDPSYAPATEALRALGRPRELSFP